MSINVQEMAVRGIVERIKTKSCSNTARPHLTCSMASIDENKQMVDELFAAEISNLYKRIINNQAEG